MEISCIDVKSDNQTVSVAVAQVLVEIDVCRFGGIPIIKVLHGYGSHGKGGEIKRELSFQLSILKKRKKIKDFFNCDKWNGESDTCKTYKKQYPILMIDEDLNSKNSGQTIIIIN